MEVLQNKIRSHFELFEPLQRAESDEKDKLNEIMK